MIGILAGNYEVRLTQILLYNSSSTGVYCYFNRWEGATMTGGTAQLAVPLRQGAPAASATVQYGSLTMSGTGKALPEFYLNPYSDSQVGNLNIYSAGTGTFQSPLPMTFQPGSALVLYGLTQTGYMVANIYFEELRLQGSY